MSKLFEISCEELELIFQNNSGKLNLPKVIEEKT